ncbi:MAG: molecular chaperone TorD family protein [Deltaproteobacteria bacterium]|nr:molecular chaperone TorD family protein [Deltaproteobacteria bacterium]
MELIRALGALAEPPGPETARLAELLDLGTPPDEAAFSEIFLFQLYPYASVYLGPEGMLGGEARDRIAGFWRALDLEPPPEPDHLAVMLSLYGRLAELEAQAEGETAQKGWRRARKAFLWEHLLSWLPFYLTRFQDLAPADSELAFYGRWAQLLQDALRAEAADLGPQATLPLHLREAPALEDPRKASGENFLGALLSPVRTGIILVRSDLQQAGRELGLGGRIGERAFVLKALMGQDSSALLRWLASWARQVSKSNSEKHSLDGDIASFWARRAENTASLLTELSQEASDS